MANMVTIGQVIKKLRKERNFTQEELAEQLNVTAQAVSKWENESGYPDISQIVPLASVFGVSTDVLFGTFGASDDDEVRNILGEVSGLKADGNTESLKRAYDVLQEGLRRYPNNLILLGNSLEIGISLAYPENCYCDETHGWEIYRECVRQANIVILYDKNISNVLRAHMIMVLLHSAYGESKTAREHAQKFPIRADLNYYEMAAFIAHSENNYCDESQYRREYFIYNFEAMLDNIVRLGEAYYYMGKYDDAITMYKSIFSLAEIIFAGEGIIPPVHCRERGDVHVMIAKAYIATDDDDKAFDWLEKMADYDINIRKSFSKDLCVETPFLRGVKHNFYYAFTPEEIAKKLKDKLNCTEFTALKNDIRFSAIIKYLDK
ncbi:transcriptional regulator [Clostridia bacterium]|nr:transcriptional regulator [Clostridia bacterium]